MGGVAVLSVLLTSCGDILSLKQEDPSRLTAESVYQPANAQLLVNGAISDFECAYHRYVVGSALLLRRWRPAGARP